MAKSWQEHAKSAMGDLSELSLEALDDVRHKVVEQAYFGQEQTGNLLDSIYGADFSNAQDDGIESPSIEPSESYVGFEARPNEDAGWWHGEPEPRQASSGEQDITPRNGWELGQDAAETREALQHEQDAPEQEM